MVDVPVPAVAPAAVFSTTSGGLTTVTFGMAGSYMFDAYVVNYRDRHAFATTVMS